MNIENGVQWPLQGHMIFLPSESIFTERLVGRYGDPLPAAQENMLQDILSMKTLDPLGGSGISSHPFVVLSRPKDDPSTVTVALMTTLGGRDLLDKFSDDCSTRSRDARDAHIPVRPASTHPMGYEPLQLRGGHIFEKACWVRTNRVWQIPLAVFEVWEQAEIEGIPFCRFDEASLQRIIKYIQRFILYKPAEQYTPLGIRDLLPKLIEDSQQGASKGDPSQRRLREMYAIGRYGKQILPESLPSPYVRLGSSRVRATLLDEPAIFASDAPLQENEFGAVIADTPDISLKTDTVEAVQKPSAFFQVSWRVTLVPATPKASAPQPSLKEQSTRKQKLDLTTETTTDTSTSRIVWPNSRLRKGLRFSDSQPSAMSSLSIRTLSRRDSAISADLDPNFELEARTLSPQWSPKEDLKVAKG